MTTTVFPDTEWKRVSPVEANMDPDKLEQARRWQEEYAADPAYQKAKMTFGEYRNGMW